MQRVIVERDIRPVAEVQPVEVARQVVIVGLSAAIGVGKSPRPPATVVADRVGATQRVHDTRETTERCVAELPLAADLIGQVGQQAEFVHGVGRRPHGGEGCVREESA